MKRFFLLIAVFTINIYSCKEVGPSIDFTLPNTSLEDTSFYVSTVGTAQHKNVLIEEFTGQMCANCLNGHIVSKAIHDAHLDSVIVMVIHSYFIPPPADWENLQIADGVELDNYLGSTSAWPAAAINRKKVGSGIIQEGTGLWTSIAESELGTQAIVNMEISTSWDASSRALRAKVTSTFLNTFTGPINLTVYLQENEIIAPQLTPTGEVEEYNHEFILRDMFTPYNGIPLSLVNDYGRVYIKEYELILPSHWDITNCNIVACIAESGDINNKEVLQAQIVPAL